MTECAILRLY